MIPRTSLKVVLAVCAVAMLIVNAWAMTPALAASNIDCQHVHASSSIGTGHQSVPSPACCADRHCCPMQPHLPTAGQPKPLEDEYQSVIKEVQPLLLIRAIDPPPRALQT
ncbi:hypothetical protein [Rhizobium sp. LC145]|uniref:hypothetical protein n=1 Tax=Rhizobium sp. LC145 TaxID=1120688 RepID=UPI0010C9C735|nr:hypothetical protein [Rhizobium sp. LC145]TKT66182.1 hypothetical protein FDR95_06805 [Rhizobiaceae bacterium LC148]